MRCLRSTVMTLGNARFVFAAVLFLFPVSAIAESDESAASVLLEDLLQLITGEIGLLEVECVPDSNIALSVHSRNFVRDLARLSRRGTKKIEIIGVSGSKESEMPLALDNWLSEIRARNGSVDYVVEDPNESTSKRIGEWIIDKATSALLKSVNSAIDLAAREMLYSPARAYDAEVRGNIERLVGGDVIYLESVTITCRD